MRRNGTAPWPWSPANRSAASGEPARRLGDLPEAEALGLRFPVATRLRARLLGLALLDRETVGPGLLIPRCRSVHTFGMRFPLDVYFLGRYGETLRVSRTVPSRRLLFHRGAHAVLEVPAAGGWDRVRFEWEEE